MRDLEYRVHGRDDPGQVGAEAGDGVIVQQDISLDFLKQTVGGARVGQRKFFPLLLKGRHQATSAGCYYIRGKV